MDKTMKRYMIIGILIVFSVMFAGCSQYENELGLHDIHNTSVDEDGGDTNEDENYEKDNYDDITVEAAPNILEFSSLEAFLNTYLITRDEKSGDITDYVLYYSTPTTGFDLYDVIAGLDIESLETLYLPVEIPEDFALGKIRIVEGFVLIYFFHKDDMVSEYTKMDAIFMQQHFAFHFHRNPVTRDESELIDSAIKRQSAMEVDYNGIRFLFHEPNLFTWYSNQLAFGLYTPLHLPGFVRELQMMDGSGEVSLRNPFEMVRFTETKAVNLLDTNAIMTLIEEVTHDVQREYEEKIEHNFDDYETYDINDEEEEENN